MSSPLTESSVERAVAGVGADVERLALHFLPRIHGLALRLTRNDDLAREATQETYVKLLKALPDLRRLERVDAWVLMIAANVVRDLIRRRGREQPLTYEPPALEAEAADDREATRARAIELALLELEVDDRELFLLHVVEGVRLKDLAAARKQTLPALTSKLHRVRSRVRAHAAGQLRTVGALA